MSTTEKPLSRPEARLLYLALVPLVEVAVRIALPWVVREALAAADLAMVQIQGLLAIHLLHLQRKVLLEERLV